MTHTPGPWRRSKATFQAVVCDTSNGLIGCTDAEVEVYGGYLVAESIAPCNLNIIAAAPDMLDALKTIENDAGQVPAWLWEMIQNAIAKAEGKAQ